MLGFKKDLSNSNLHTEKKVYNSDLRKELMGYDAKQVANYFIKKGIEHEKPITPMKAIKLTYIAHGWSLAIFNKPLIDESIHAWKYGPVIDSLYHSLKKYGNQAINGAIKTFVLQNGKIASVEENIPEYDRQTLNLLDKVWEVYGQYSGTQLSSMTHAQGTPWEQTVSPYREKGYLPFGLSISDEIIKQHFKEKAQS